MEGQKTELKMIRMSEVESQKVKWLWYPFIPYGKLTIIQGDPGDGKTTLVLNIAAKLSKGESLDSDMNVQESVNVIYQTAEDGLADTVKPRLELAGADCEKILVIDESDKSLSMADERLEEALAKTGAKVLILDPIQAYLGGGMDMNRANEIREVMKSVGQVAQRTGCAVVLVGHLNKAAGLSSAYRGLGSIDFRAAARSVLVVGRLRKNKTVRIVVHDKSSLAPEGKSLAFQLGDEEGFRWLDGYDEISAEELLSGFTSQPETKTAQAEALIRSMLEDGEEIHCEEIIRAAAERRISRRTVNEAKKNISGIVTRKAGARWMWSLQNEDCNIAEVSLKEG